jgi:hypothetical protein
MRSRDTVLMCHPEARVIEESLCLQRSVRVQRGCWFIYSGPDVDARVLGRGTTEGKAWADAARRLKIPGRTARLVLA